MATQTEALSVEDTLKLALAALETCYSSETSMYRNFDKEKTDNAITAIKDVLEAHKSLMSLQDGANHIPDVKNMVAQPAIASEQICGFDVVLDESMPPDTFKLAQPAVAEQHKQEPVAWLTDRDTMYFDKEDARRDCDGFIFPLYTTPPQRRWVGLTEEDWDYLNKYCGSTRSAIQTAETLLKEKNT